MNKLYKKFYETAKESWRNTLLLQYDELDADAGAERYASEDLEAFENKPLEIVNLTPHELTYVREDGTEESMPPSGIVARCKEVKNQTGFVNTKIGRIPVITKKLLEVENLPEADENKIFIVSLAVKQAVGDTRPDVFAIGDTRRDEKNRIDGFFSLSEG